MSTHPSGHGRRICAVVSLVAIAGCGGGGGGGGGTGGPAPPPPVARPSVTITASPAQVDHGGTTTLAWSSSNATACTASGDVSGWSGSRPVRGSETVSGLTATSTFRLSCSNAGGDASAATSVTVRPPLAPTLQLSVSPPLVQRGQPVTLTWTSTGATSCTARWGNLPALPLNGSQDFLIEGAPVRRNFGVQCDGPGGSIEKWVGADVQTLSGKLLVTPGIKADTDVNDPDAEYLANDSIDTRIPIASFGVVPGYVNQPRAGPAGRSYEAGDPSDFFAASGMDAGQVIRLILPTVDENDPVVSRDDADLYLYDNDYGRLVDAAVGSGAIETLVVPSDGTYVIEVRAVRGGMNYLLSLEDPASPAAATAERLSASFVAGEALVVLEPGAAGASRKPRAGAAPGPALAASVNVTRHVFPASVLGRSKARLAAAALRADGSVALDDAQAARLATLLELKELRRRDDFRHAELNRIVGSLAVEPRDPQFSRQWWHYSLVNLPLAWQVTTGSPEVIVAVVDSGVVRDHPDLRDKLVDGYDFVSDPQGLDRNGLDPDPSDPGYGSAGRWIFHGTHVAGTIGAATDNGIGGAGVSWGARLMPVRVLDGRFGTLHDVLQGVRYAAGLANDSGRLPARRADIINLSLGADGECTALEAELYRQVAAAGVILVAAAGNDGGSRARAPASCPDVFSVGAAGPNGIRSSYSSYGPSLDLLAPGGTSGAGEGIFSTHGVRNGTTLEPSYDWMTGTSMAAPHFSGVLALMKSVRPALTPLQVRQALEASLLTDPTFLRLGASSGRDDLEGYGLLDAAKALAAAGGEIPSAPRLSVTPLSMHFDNFTDTAAFRVRNGGSGTLTVHAVRPTVGWATVTPLADNVAGIGSYRVDVTREGFLRGQRSGSIVVESSAGTQEIRLTGSYVDYNVQPQPGRVHVRVIDAASGATVRKAFTSVIPERDSFQFDDVPPGRYVIVAGTDMNNDGQLCDPGELCGGYPTGALPDYIDYTGVRVGLELPLEITALSTGSAAAMRSAGGVSGRHGPGRP